MVDEYMAIDLANDQEDEKRMEKANRAAKCKASKQSKSPQERAERLGSTRGEAEVD